MKVHECILSLFGGIAVFITAMNLMSSNLQKIAGSKMKLLLTQKANNSLIYAAMGAIIAMVIQSSAAVTVMAIGFVNADMINLSQASAVIMGANFGCSIIGVLASLESLNINVYFSFVSFIGIVFTFFKKEKFQAIGGIICGLGMIFIGLNLMKESCDHESFKNVLRSALIKIDFPLFLVLIGTIFTALIQSSSAMTGLIIVMVQGDAMDMKSGLFIILGANIGTSATTIISTIGKSLNSRRTGIIYLIFKIFGTGVFTIFTWIFSNGIIKILGKINKNPAMQIAWFNVFFKLFSSLISLPIRNIFVFIATKIIKGEKEKSDKKQWRKAFKYINKRFLKVPIIAEEQIKKEIKIIIDLSKKNMDINISELLEQNNKYNAEINVTKDLINYLNFESAKFLVKIKKPINEKIDDEISNNFLLLNHLIKINKYINEIFEINIKMKNKEIKFNEEEIKDITNLKELINKLFDLVIKSFDENHENKNGEYIMLIEKIRKIQNSLFQQNYINTITGKISVSLGFNFIYILSDFEKICSNLEKMITIIKKEKGNLKNKSFEHRNDYDILLIKHKNSLLINSSSRNTLSLDKGSIKDENTNDKLNKSIN